MTLGHLKKAFTSLPLCRVLTTSLKYSHILQQKIQLDSKIFGVLKASRGHHLTVAENSSAKSLLHTQKSHQSNDMAGIKVEMKLSQQSNGCGAQDVVETIWFLTPKLNAYKKAYREIGVERGAGRPSAQVE